MSTITRRARNGLFSGAVLAVLGFGATQAFAAPAAEADAKACSFTACRRYCVDTCPPGSGSCFGYCEGGECVCEYS